MERCCCKRLRLLWTAFLLGWDGDYRATGTIQKNPPKRPNVYVPLLEVYIFTVYMLLAGLYNTTVTGKAAAFTQVQSVPKYKAKWDEYLKIQKKQTSAAFLISIKNIKQ